MKPDKELANDLIFGMLSLVLENTLLRAYIAQRLGVEAAAHIEKMIASAKTDRAMIRGALVGIAPTIELLPDADDPEQLAEKYRAMHLFPMGPETLS